MMTTLQMFLLSVEEPIRNIFTHSCLIIFYCIFVVLYMYCFMAGYQQVSVLNISYYLTETRRILTLALRQLQLGCIPAQRSIYWMWMHLNFPSSLVSAIAIGSFFVFNIILPKNKDMPVLNTILIKSVESYSSVNLVRSLMQDNQIILVAAVFTSIAFLSVACVKMVVKVWTQYVFFTIRSIFVMPLRYINPRLVVHKSRKYFLQGGTSRINQEHPIRQSKGISDKTLGSFYDDKALPNATVKHNFENGEILESLEFKGTNYLQSKSVGATHSQSIKESKADFATNITAENDIVEFFDNIQQVGEDFGKHEKDLKTLEGAKSVEKYKEIVHDKAIDLYLQIPTEKQVFEYAEVPVAETEVKNAFTLNGNISVKDQNLKFSEKHQSDKVQKLIFAQHEMRNAIKDSVSEVGFTTMERSRNANSSKPEYKYARNRISYKVTKGLSSLGNIYKPKFSPIKRWSSPLPKKRNAEPNAVKGLIQFYENSNKKKRFYCSGNSVNEIDLRFINSIY